MSNTFSILSTRELDKNFNQEILSLGIRVDAVPFISIEYVDNVETQQEVELLETYKADVAFTSVNAVKAVAALLHGSMPSWNVYCIGHATQQSVREYFPNSSIAGVANDSNSLAELIVINNNCEVLFFFCGDKRKDDLPHRLNEAGIAVNEIIVYYTRLQPQKMEDFYNAVLFFSPSAVDSFFKLNNDNPDTAFFAIGNTTAKQISRYSQHKVIVAAEPNSASLLKSLAEYFGLNN